jgi:surfeit locus 1 family protein
MMHELLRPKAVVGHVLVLTVVVVCVVLGQWQLDRLSTVRDANALAAERLTAPPADLATLADPSSEATVDEAELEHLRVEVTGTYRTDEEVLQRNRSYQNQAGYHVLTPLELSDGGVVLVRRGWVPSELDEPPVAEAAPPAGEVTVAGVLERPVDQPWFGAQDPDDGVLERVFHTDTARLDRQVDGELFAMVLRIDDVPEGAATVDDLPVPAGPPTLDERNHFSYAMQWHAFGLLALVTYGAWLWKRIRRGAGPVDDPDEDGGGGGRGPDDGARDRPPAGIGAAPR